MLLCKRLETGRFRLPPVDEGAQTVQLDATQLAMLLDGIKAEVSRIGGEVDALKGQLAALQRHVFGRRTERLPTVASELRGDADATAAQAEAAKMRQQRAARKAEQAPSREIRHAVPAEERYCPACGGEDLRPLGKGRASVLYEHIPARFERQVHV